MTPEQQCSQQWEFYLCSLDEAPASILVDMSAVSAAPIADLPFLASIRVQLQMPDPEGMSSAAELDQLTAIEDHLLTVLPRTGAARYVGRCTATGHRVFYFYIARAEQWPQRAAAAMARFSHFAFEAATRAERNWETYFDVLYPDEEDLQRIQNRRVCDVLEENGDELITAREIEHWAYFPDTAARARFIATIEALGFKIHELWDEQEESRCGIRFSRVDLPSFTGIDEVTLPLYQAALAEGGNYDGWETQVIRK